MISPPGSEWERKASNSPNDLFFCLGGRDLEMRTIAALLAEHALGRYADKGLTWERAYASAYREEIAGALRVNLTPVLVELQDDLRLPRHRIMQVDHHGPRAGRDQPTSLEQVWVLLDLPPANWTRRHQLVAANDRGHIRGLREAGASDAEILAIRGADLKAQGVTEAELLAAREALTRRKVVGGLTIVTLPHERSSLIGDLLDPVCGGPGGDNVLVRSPRHVLFRGNGAVVAQLDGRFPGGWYGGELPCRGYWGHTTDPLDEPSLLGFLMDRLAATRLKPRKLPWPGGHAQ